MQSTQSARTSSRELMEFELHHDINLQTEVEHQIELLGVKKARLASVRVFILGILSGLWMSLAGTFANQGATAIGEDAKRYMPILPKLILSLFAPVAMYFIVIFGGEFYSGNCMFMCVALFKGRISFLRVLYNWFLTFTSNSVGCLLGVWAFASITQVFHTEEQIDFLRHGAEYKAGLDFWTSFWRGIPANFMICTSIQMGIAARDMLGKLVVLHFPLMLYTIVGWEHALTNMIVVPLGCMYGAEVDLGVWLVNNLIPAAIGNAIGGGLLVGGLETVLFSWDKGQSNTNQLHTHAEGYQPKFSTIRKLRLPGLPSGNKNLKKKLQAAQKELSVVLEDLEKSKVELQKMNVAMSSYDDLEECAAVQEAYHAAMEVTRRKPRQGTEERDASE